MTISTYSSSFGKEKQTYARPNRDTTKIAATVHRAFLVFIVGSDIVAFTFPVDFIGAFADPKRRKNVLEKYYLISHENNEDIE